MAFVAPLPLAQRPCRAPARARPPAPAPAPALPRRVAPPRVAPTSAASDAAAAAAAATAAAQPQPQLRTQVYAPDDDDVCTFGEECCIPEDVVRASPALDHLLHKYVLPVREHNTQVFFDNALSPAHTLMLVFARDRHGLVLDVVSVLKALGVRVHRTASGESDALQLVLHRIEGELRSVRALGLSLSNCVAFWLSDERGADKIDDGARLDQLTTCVKLELNTPHPRPRPASERDWHRISVQKNRADRFSVFSVQTADRPRLLAELTNAFAAAHIDVASATINTFSDRVENTFFVTKHGFKQPLCEHDIKLALRNVARALLKVGRREPHETLWYQVRDGTAVVIAEAIFIDEVNNRELEMLRFSHFETPNFRGRLPDVPYCPIHPHDEQ